MLIYMANNFSLFFYKPHPLTSVSVCLSSVSLCHPHIVFPSFLPVSCLVHFKHSDWVTQVIPWKRTNVGGCKAHGLDTRSHTLALTDYKTYQKLWKDFVLEVGVLHLNLTHLMAIDPSDSCMNKGVKASKSGPGTSCHHELASGFIYFLAFLYPSCGCSNSDINRLP